MSNFPPKIGDHSPWGVIDNVQRMSDDAYSVSTPSHGGIVISETEWNQLDPTIQKASFTRSRYFEEDCDWAIPYLLLNLGAQYRKQAWESIERFHPKLASLIEIGLAEKLNSYAFPPSVGDNSAWGKVTATEALNHWLVEITAEHGSGVVLNPTAWDSFDKDLRTASSTTSRYYSYEKDWCVAYLAVGARSEDLEEARLSLKHFFPQLADRLDPEGKDHVPW